MRKVLVTGLGFVTSIGIDRATVEESLRGLRHGIRLSSEMQNAPNSPVFLMGEIPAFDVSSNDPEDWSFPERYAMKREVLRPMSPSALFGYCATEQAIDDAGLDAALVKDGRTGMFTANSGSPFMTHHQLLRLAKHGPTRCSPMCIVAGAPGTVTYNLVAAYGITGPSCGYVSACASSAHALGAAWDAIALGRIDRAIVVGAEDCNKEIALGFASMRALSRSKDPDTASRPFDVKRDGFVATGGAATLILESEESARLRSVEPYCRFVGWGQASDGYSVAISHPDGLGLVNAMRASLECAGVSREQVDYINAHGTSTPIGDRSEIRALKTVFGESSPVAISSTKALTGHGLSMTSAMEAGFTALSIRGGFTPGSAHITELDPEAEGLNILLETFDKGPALAISNSSGFGGANVSLVLGRMD